MDADERFHEGVDFLKVVVDGVIHCVLSYCGFTIFIGAESCLSWLEQLFCLLGKSVS